MIARGGDLTSLLGAAGLTDNQWLIGAAPALVLLILWEVGKAIARSRSGDDAKDAAHRAPHARP